MNDPVTRRRLGPADAGVALNHAEYVQADFAPGYHYELVAGMLCVNPVPNLPHDLDETWIYKVLMRYWDEHPEVISYITNRSRIITRALGGECDVEPDLSVYAGVPGGLHKRMAWEDLSPVLVVEVISPSQPTKDLERNRRLYWEVASVQEYWILDPRQGETTMLALVREETDWREVAVASDAVYTTDLFPGLVIDLSTQPH